MSTTKLSTIAAAAMTVMSGVGSKVKRHPNALLNALAIEKRFLLAFWSSIGGVKSTKRRKTKKCVNHIKSRINKRRSSVQLREFYLNN